MQSVLIMQCFICKVSVLYSALYAKWPYYVVLYMQTVLIIQCFTCRVSWLFSTLYAKCPYYCVLTLILTHVQATARARAPVTSLDRWLRELSRATCVIIAFIFTTRSSAVFWGPKPSTSVIAYNLSASFMTCRSRGSDRALSAETNPGTWQLQFDRTGLLGCVVMRACTATL